MSSRSLQRGPGCLFHAANALLLSALLAPSASAVPPPNDDCLTPTVLIEGFPILGTTIDATTGPGGTACSPSSLDVYFVLIPSTTDFYQITLCDSTPEWDSVISLHAGCPATPLNELTCNNNTCGLQAQLDAVKLSAGFPYLIRVANAGNPPVGNNFTVAAVRVLTAACCDPAGRCTWTAPINGPCPGTKVRIIKGAACNPKFNPCTIKGACCLPSGLPVQPDPSDPEQGLPPSQRPTCVYVTDSDCTALGGFFLGGGTSCDPDPCADGACCTPDGGCLTTSPAACADLSGNFVGAFSVCSPLACALGACCCGAACILTDPASCLGTNRIFEGLGTSCQPYDFDQPCCRADFNKSGSLSVQDIFDFLVAYFAEDPCADITGNGTVFVTDLFDFFTAYFTVCN
ncbi:MAG: hypothetical protein ACK4WH_09720 [Phycisphaerales bacterium]